METWFDPETGLFRLDEVAAERPTLKNILADGVVTDGELAAQSALVVDLLRRAETALAPEQRALVWDLLAEMAVLYTATQCHAFQETSRR